METKFKGFYAAIENKTQFSERVAVWVCNETETHYKVAAVKRQMGKFKTEYTVSQNKGMVLKSRVSGKFQSAAEACASC